MAHVEVGLEDEIGEAGRETRYLWTGDDGISDMSSQFLTVRARRKEFVGQTDVTDRTVLCVLKAYN